MPKLEIMPNQTGQLGTGSQTGAEFKADLKSGKVKFGIFVNSASPIVAEQLSFSGYDCAPPLPAPSSPERAPLCAPAARRPRRPRAPCLGT